MTSCKHCYKLRWFHSKGALLVLVWTLLGSLALSSTYEIYRHDNRYSEWFIDLPSLFAVFGVVVSGWLADAKLGNYKVIKYGIWILFVSTLLMSVTTLIPNNFSLLNKIMMFVEGSLFFMGIASFIVTSLQLGLDQMPDASSTNITSFIAWFVLTLSSSVWCVRSLVYPLLKCFTDYESSQFVTAIQLYSLVPPSCIAIILVLDYTLSSKWLIIEPKSPQLLKTIYRVLKFAAKHKAPLNRSALTYWEEDVPSRMDLGKSRYGGPFTTEQVEDVKTVLRLFVFGLSLTVSSFSLGLGNPISLSQATHFLNLTSCNEMPLVLMSDYGFYTLWILIHEFVGYPLFRNKLICISIVKKIGIVILLATVLSIVFLIIELVHYYAAPQVNVLPLVLLLSMEISNGILAASLVCSILEFICSQAPYNMRGFFAGYSIFLTVSSTGIGNLANSVCSHENAECAQVFSGVKAAMSMLGLILYCVVARWYKMRVRDEDYYPQPVVEEIYDRYLSARN